MFAEVITTYLGRQSVTDCQGVLKLPGASRRNSQQQACRPTNHTFITLQLGSSGVRCAPAIDLVNSECLESYLAPIAEY